MKWNRKGSIRLFSFKTITTKDVTAAICTSCEKRSQFNCFFSHNSFSLSTYVKWRVYLVRPRYYAGDSVMSDHELHYLIKTPWNTRNTYFKSFLVSNKRGQRKKGCPKSKHQHQLVLKSLFLDWKVVCKIRDSLFNIYSWHLKWIFHRYCCV